MLWVCIVGYELVRIFKLEDHVKINSQNFKEGLYGQHLDKRQALKFRENSVTSHALKFGKFY